MPHLLLLLSSCCVLSPIAAARPSGPLAVWVMHAAYWLLLLLGFSAACLLKTFCNGMTALAILGMFT